MRRRSMAALVIATFIGITSVAVLTGSPAAGRTSTIRRSLGFAISGSSGGSITANAWNPTGRTQHVVFEVKAGSTFANAIVQTLDVPPGDGLAVHFNCPAASYCGGVLVARSSPRVVLDAEWARDGALYLAHAGDWVRY